MSAIRRVFVRGLLIILYTSAVSVAATAQDSMPAAFERQGQGSLFSLSTKWDVSDWGVDGILMRASHDISPQDQLRCDRVDFVQVVRTSYSDQTQTVWRGSESARMELKNSSGSFVDHLASRCKKGEPCSAYYNDHFNRASSLQVAGSVQSKEMSTALHDIRSVTMEDFPHGFAENYPYGFDSFEAEVCLRCDRTGEFLGCAHWGGEFPIVGDEKIIYETTWRREASANFKEALFIFESYYSSSK